MYDLQRANMWKRISALLFDLIILLIVVVGAALLLSWVLGYDAQTVKLEEIKERYEEQYAVDFDIGSAEYGGLTDGEKEVFDTAYAAFSEDAEAGRLWGLLINLTLLIVIFSILLGYLLLEFAVPLLLGNGQTLGKKIFGIGVMREDGVRITPTLLLIRTVLGKYTVETMIPVLIVLMFLFNVIGLLGTIFLLALLIIQIVMITTTRGRTPIHDMLSHTVTVDLASQKIFDSPEALLAYKEKIHAARAQNADY